MSGKSEISADRTAPTTNPPDLNALVARYLGGESMESLGKACGRSRRTMYRFFLSELGDKGYRDLVTECLVARVADADAELEASRKSKDPVRVSAARETCRFMRMDLERRRPALYGPKQEVKHSGMAPTLNIVLLAEPTGGAVVQGTQVASLRESLPAALEDKTEGRA